jgi:hypothetical protein
MAMTTKDHALDWRQPLWLATLVAASVAFSLGLACAVPLAAFGALGAITFDRRTALLLIVGVVVANQIVGFTVLHYPRDLATIAWGPAFLIVGVVSTLAAFWTHRLSTNWRPLVAVPAIFFAAFITYEGSFFLISLLTGAGLYAYAPSTVFRIFETNALAFAGLLLARGIAMAARKPAENFRDKLLPPNGFQPSQQKIFEAVRRRSE